MQKSITLTLVFVLFFADMQSMFTIPFLPQIEEAQAATGDIAVFRETTGTETVNSTGIPYNHTWDTTVQSSSNITLQSDDTSIDLADGGKYFVMYNAWAEQGTSTAGANRRSISTYLTLNGTQTAYGRGNGYIRDSDNYLTAYAASGAIIDANSGDDLQLHVQRTDTNTTAGTNIPPDTNGINIIKLNDNWDYLRLRKTATSSAINENTTFTDVTWDTSDEVDTDSFAFTPTSGAVTLKGATGTHFMLATNVDLLNTAGGIDRQNYEMQLTLDGTEIDGSRVTAYIRGTDGTLSGSLVYTGIITKTTAADQTLNVEVRRESSADATTVIQGDRTALSIAKLSDTARYAMLTDHSGTQELTASRVAMNFDTNNEVNTSTFNHSTTTNTSRINLEKSGNYLFFSTAYTKTAPGGANRQPHKIDWHKTGSLMPYGGHGALNRENGAYGGGSSGGLIFSGLTSSDYVEITHVDETLSPPDDAIFDAGRVAIQGVALDNNFFETGVIVNGTGSHSTTIDIPATAQYQGGSFAIKEFSGSRNITSITLTESGTVDASTGLDTIAMYYDIDSSAPYDCTSESYSGTESQFGTTDTTGFSGADGVSSFSDSVAIDTTHTFCGYVLYDVTDSADDGQTIVITIDDPSSDVIVSGGATVGPSEESVGPSGSTVLQNAELTQIHYHWRNDDGSETTATSIDGSEDTPVIGFANGTTRRLRMEVSAEGSTSSPSVEYRLEYAQKVTTCDAVGSWTDVGTGGGGDWDVVDTANLTDGNNTTNIALAANGAVTDENTTFLVSNGGQKDTSSQTSGFILSDSEFIELEYAIEPTITASEGNTYCFRVSNAGTALKNYNIYAEGTVSADIDVSASSSQVASLDVGSTGQYIGGTFVIKRPGTARTLTDITLTETGTVDASTGLTNPTLYYDLDTVAPYDCAGESYAPTDSNIAGTAFSGPNGTTTFTGSVTLDSTQTFCGYLAFDVVHGAEDGTTIDIGINDPATDVVVAGSSVGPSTVVSPTGNTTIAGPILTQTHYHWRNDDGTESLASSATDGAEDTTLLDVPKFSTKRLRMQVSNEGSVASAPTHYRLEYGTKVTTCDAINYWQDIDTGTSFVMSSTSLLVDDSDTTDIATSTGGVSNPSGKTFVTSNGGQKEETSETADVTLSSTQYVELEYAIETTADSAFNTTYCFRVTDAGDSLDNYTKFAQLTTRENQDFYVQRGVTMVSGTSSTLVAGVDYVAPSASTSAFFRITNTQMTGAGNDIGGGPQNADDVTAYISNPENIETSLTIMRPPTATNNTRVAWEIIEFIGIEGSDNEMIVRDRGTVTYGASSLTATGTLLSNVSNDSKVAVFITGQLNPSAGTNNYNDGLSTSQWNDSLQAPVFTRGDADSVAAALSYVVVEYAGANWNVQRVEHQYATAGVTETESITAIGSLSSAFIHTQKRVGDALTNLDEYGAEVWLSSMGAVSFALQPGATSPADHYSVVWVIENTQTGAGAMTVQRSNGALSQGSCGGIEPCLEIISISPKIKPSNASLFATNRGSGVGDAHPRTIISMSIASSTAYEAWRSDTGQTETFRTEIIQWPVAEMSARQHYYRFYVNNDALIPTDVWPVGPEQLGENTSITSVDEPLGEGETVRIRMSLFINNASMPENSSSFTLQFGRRITSCSAIALNSTWVDLGAPDSGAIWRGYNNSVADGTSLATSTPAPGTLLITGSTVAGTYEENNDTQVNSYPVDIKEIIEYDWTIEHNGALQRTDYCFRMVNSDDSELNGYNNYPTLRTTGYTPVVGDWRWYEDEEEETPQSPLADENVAPSDIANQDTIKLRVLSSEVENAVGTNVKFGLQYSQYPDFSDGGTLLTSSSSCSTTATWCYAEGTGEDNAPITTATLTNADACELGSGDGCGTHNEAATSTSSHMQPASSNMEFEFTLRPAAPRVNGVYYFRLYDITNDDPLVASSSYPSLVTEGATLAFGLSGITAGTVIDGQTLDVTSSPTAIPFGVVPFDTEYVAGYRLNINTNATEGYMVLMYSDQQLLNTYGGQIEPVTGNNSAPTNWSTGCSASAAGCFGYHVEDDVLSSGSTRFALDDSYAGLSTTPQEVMYSSVPTEDTHDILYKLQLSEEQAAGDYEAAVTFISIPIF